jgi:hypothetical protein
LLLAFLSLQIFLPLSTAVRIGADEDFELSKATLCNHGYKLYSEVWNDQPPLHTFLIASILKHVSHSVLGPRLLTVASATLLLAASFILIHAVNGLLAASIATAALMASPGFLELSCSAMLEIPALAPIVVSLCLLFVGPNTKWRRTEIAAGALFGIGLQMKLIGVAYLPLAALIIWLGAPASRRRVEIVAHASRPRNRPEAPTSVAPALSLSHLRQFCISSSTFGASLLLSILLLSYLTGNSLALQFQQAWVAHFAHTETPTVGYGAPSDHPYNWSVLLKNWDSTVPGLFGLFILIASLRRERRALLPIGWLLLTFSVFANHKPWWAYYYVHNALPICWCAGAGLAFLWNHLRRRLPLSSLGGEGRGEEAPNQIRTVTPSWPAGRSPSPPREERVGESRPIHAQADRDEATSKPTKPTSSPFPNRKPPTVYWLRATAFALFALCALGWMTARIYLEEDTIRTSPKLYTCLALREIERFKPFTRFMFSDQSIYSFYADLPMPPYLAVNSIKRFWAGQLSIPKMVTELEASKPGLILLCRDPDEVPYKDLLMRDYKLVYQDSSQRLFAHASIAKLPPL